MLALNLTLSLRFILKAGTYQVFLSDTKKEIIKRMKPLHERREQFFSTSPHNELI